MNDQGLEECRCKDGYQGDGTKCEGVVAFKPSNTLMHF